MSDTSAEQPQAGVDQDQQEQQQGERPEFDPTYIERLRRENARYRTEAKANAQAAKRLQEIEDAQKTEAQKHSDRITKLERELEAERAAKLRFKIAGDYKITSEDAELFLTGTDEETLIKQAERLNQRGSTDQKQTNPGWRTGEGRGQRSGDPDLAFAEQLFGQK
jgi:plasmid maintenance system killer protein